MRGADRGAAQEQARHRVTRRPPRPRPDVPASVRKLPTPNRPGVRQSTRPHSSLRPHDCHCLCRSPRRPRAPRDGRRSRPSVTRCGSPCRRDPREAAACAGSAASFDSERRSRCDLRSRADRAAGRTRAQAKLAAVAAHGAARSSAGSRHIPAAARRAVWLRDGGQCAFVDPRAMLRAGFLEFHHVEAVRGRRRGERVRTSSSVAERTTLRGRAVFRRVDGRCWCGRRALTYAT